MSSQPGPPYAPQNAALGGRPTVGVDGPICGVLIALFITGAAGHMTVFQLNRRRSHKFVLSGLLFGFCMARTVANVLRIAWASRPNNIRLAIAANVFSNAGILLLFIVNLIFSQRVLRAYHPIIGWSKPGKLFFRFIYFSIFANLVMLVTATVYSFFTLDPGLHSKLRDIQLTASVFLAVLAFLPIPTIAVCLLLPRKAPLEKFGQGRMRTKIYLLLFTSTLLSFGAGFRTGVSFIQRPINNPAWFHHKACYFCINFVIELIVVFSYLLSRFDRIFHVPDGSRKAGDYSSSVNSAKSRKNAHQINTEEEVFGDDEPPRTMEEQRHQEQDWESSLKCEIQKEMV